MRRKRSVDQQPRADLVWVGEKQLTLDVARHDHRLARQTVRHRNGACVRHREQAAAVCAGVVDGEVDDAHVAALTDHHVNDRARVIGAQRDLDSSVALKEVRDRARHEGKRDGRRRCNVQRAALLRPDLMGGACDALHADQRAVDLFVERMRLHSGMQPPA